MDEIPLMLNYEWDIFSTGYNCVIIKCYVVDWIFFSCLFWHKYIYEHILDCDRPFNILHLQKPIGLISLLDEESNFPNGSDLTFANKLKQHLSASPCFKEERGGAFSIRHYAGEVS